MSVRSGDDVVVMAADMVGSGENLAVDDDELPIPSVAVAAPLPPTSSSTLYHAHSSPTPPPKNPRALRQERMRRPSKDAEQEEKAEAASGAVMYENELASLAEVRGVKGNKELAKNQEKEKKSVPSNDDDDDDDDDKLEVIAYTEECPISAVSDEERTQDQQARREMEARQPEPAYAKLSVLFLGTSFLFATFGVILGYLSGTWFDESLSSGCSDASKANAAAWFSHGVCIASLAFAWAAPVVRHNLEESLAAQNRRLNEVQNKIVYNFIWISKLVGWFLLCACVIMGARAALMSSSYRSNCCDFSKAIEEYRKEQIMGTGTLATTLAPPPAPSSLQEMPSPPPLPPFKRESFYKTNVYGRRLQMSHPHDTPTNRRNGAKSSGMNPQFTLRELEMGAKEGGEQCGVLSTKPPELLSAPVVSVLGVMLLVAAMFCSERFWASSMLLLSSGSVLWNFAQRALNFTCISQSPSLAATLDASLRGGENFNNGVGEHADMQIVEPTVPPPATESLDVQDSSRKLTAHGAVAVVIVPGSSDEHMLDRVLVARVVP